MAAEPDALLLSPSEDPLAFFVPPAAAAAAEDGGSGFEAWSQAGSSGFDTSGFHAALKSAGERDGTRVL